MHFEFLIEDQSGKAAMEVLAPRLLSEGDTFHLYAYKGIGHIPKGLRPKTDARKRILLDQLPRLLRGYGRNPYSGCIVVICDLDTSDKHDLLSALDGVLNACDPKPNALFCLAIEEFEAWYLGDLEAIRRAYPAAKESVLRNYVNDSICGTWEVLADAIYKGGSKALCKAGWQAIGEQKSIWANAIAPHMCIDANVSPSFRDMCMRLKGMTTCA